MQSFMPLLERPRLNGQDATIQWIKVITEKLLNE